MEVAAANEFLRGKYFCTTADVWGVDHKEHTAKHWEAFWRKEDSASQNGHPEQVNTLSIRVASVKKKTDDQRPELYDPYNATTIAMTDCRVPAPIKGTRSNSASVRSVREAIWPVDIVGEKDIDSFHQLAHLLPAGKEVHEQWCGVAAAVIGLPHDASIKQKLMAVRGVKKDNDEENDNDQEQAEAPTSPPVKAAAKQETCATASEPPPSTPASNNRKRRRNSGVSFTPDTSQGSSASRARKERIDLTGVVHFVSNKIRLADKKYLLDGNDPKMLIVPCMTLKEANEWRGQGYQAVVLAGLPNLTGSAPPAYRDYDAEKLPARAFGRAAMNTDAFLERYADTQKVTPEQEMKMLEKARIDLQEAVLGLAHYAKQMASDAKKGLLEGLQKSTIEAFESIGASLPKEAPVPKVHANPKKPVLFVKFGSLQEVPKDLHPAPDPELLLSKAATIWGKMTNFAMIANGSVTDDEEEEDSLDEVAEEAFYEKYHRNSSAPPIPMEISVVSPGDRVKPPVGRS